MEQEEIHVEVEHVDIELHNPYEVMEEAKVDVENEETDNDYLMAREVSRRVIKPPQRIGYAYLIAFTLISAMRYLMKNP